MPDRDLPSIEYLRQRLRYEPETGKLFWREWPAHGPAWNAKWAGREAFTAINGRGYLCGNIDGWQYRAHQIVWALTRGSWPDGALDHASRDRLDNRKGNLRPSSSAHNNKNLSRACNNTSGVTGVHWHAVTGKWCAQIGSRKNHQYLGLFAAFDDAVAARKTAESERGFDPGHGSPRKITG